MKATLVKASDNMALPHSGNMSPVARQYLSGLKSPGSTVLPGCTANEPTGKPSYISNEMLQAYVSMRGPSDSFGNDPEDPLLDWVLFRDNLEKQNGTNDKSGKKDIRRMISNVGRVLQSDACPVDSPQTAEFEYHRPPINHIQPPRSMDLSMHILNACCADFEFEEYEDSDEEDHAFSGRISPCTFLAWSRGCSSWKDQRHQVLDPEVLSRALRRRPKSPEYGNTPPSTTRSDRWPKWTSNQECVVSGLPLSPHYPVPTSPSVLWVAEGIDSDRMDWKPHFEDYYSRMDYKAAKKLRALKQFGKPDSEPMSLTSKSENIYAHSEVDKIVADDIQKIVPNMDTEGAQTHIRNQYSLIEAADGKSKELHSKIQRQTLRIRELETQRETVQLAVWNLKNKRAEEHLHALRNPIPEDTERRQHILGHFRAHLKDLDYKYTRTIAKLDQEREKEQANDDTICALENDISAACKEMGKQDPEGLYKELSGGVTGYRVRDPRVDTQAAVQFRSGFTNSKARPSSLRTVRSEAQTVIAPAPLQESDALVNVAQLTTPERQFYVQHPPFFHPQFGFSDPNAMYANYGNIGCVDNGRMGVGGPNTGGNDVETQGNSLEKDFQPTGPGFDVYDAQGFPISPNGLAVKPLPGLVPGYNDSPNRAYRVPMMPFPWMMPVHGHGQGPGFDGSIGFGGNVIPGCGMQQPSPTRRGSPTGREEHGASLKISPTRRKGTSFKPVKDASDEHGY